MTDEQKAAYVYASTVAAYAEIEGMKALNDERASKGLAQANGEDIRFSLSPDDPLTSLLTYEIESWDSLNHEAIIWVKLPAVSSDIATPTEFYLYYGNAAALDAQDYGINAMNSQFDALVAKLKNMPSVHVYELPAYEAAQWLDDTIYPLLQLAMYDILTPDEIAQVMEVVEEAQAALEAGL